MAPASICDYNSCDSCRLAVNNWPSAATLTSVQRGCASFAWPDLLCMLCGAADMFWQWQHVALRPTWYHLLCTLSWGHVHTGRLRLRLRLQSLLISLLNMLTLICHNSVAYACCCCCLSCLAYSAAASRSPTAFPWVCILKNLIENL